MDIQKLKSAAGSPLVTVLAVVAAFYAGWHLRPAEVKIVENVKATETRHEVETSKAGLTFDDVRKVFAEFQKNFNVSRTKTTLKLPDGTVKIDEHTEDKSVVSEKSGSTETKKSDLTLDVKKTADVSKTEERHIEIIPQLRAPDWEFAAGVGFAVPSLWGSTPQTYVPYLPAILDLRLRLERRVLGGISLYVEGDTRLRVGAGLAVRW